MSEWEYHPPLDIDESMAGQLRNFPRQPYILIYAIRSVAALILRAWMRLYHRLRIDGRQNLLDDRSYVLVCNHTSHLDTLCLLSLVPLSKIHRTFPAAATDYFFSSMPRTVASAVLINALPFNRKIRCAKSLAICSELLNSDANVLIIFPEGTRTTTGKMGSFRSGIGRLVVGTRLSVLPCHLEGGMAAWPKGKFFPRPRRLHLRIGQARTYTHLQKTKESVREICRDLQQSVAELGRLDA